MQSAEDRVECGECHATLDEAPNLAPEDRPPCPHCGSTKRSHVCAGKGGAFTITSFAATLDVRYSFGPQFVCAAAFFASEAQRLEDGGEAVTEDARMQHLAYVVGAVMQAVASLETEITEVVMHGPGCHLGSDHTDHAARDFLKPLRDVIDPLAVADRYDFVLHVLKKPPLDHSKQFWARTTLLIALRNELVHYRSHWGAEMEPTTPDKPKKLLVRLKELKLARPPWVPPSPQTNFFPHQCLSAGCARWAVETAVAFIDEFYKQLGVASRLDAYRSRLQV